MEKPAWAIHQWRAMGEQACLVYLGDEAQAWAFAHQARMAHFSWLVEAVQAYTTVAIFFDLMQISYAQVVQTVGHLPPTCPEPGDAARTLYIPCCYDLGLDGERIAHFTGLTQANLVRLHSQTSYTVYAIGFCPGFPYLGYLPEPLSGVPRLDTPRVRVEEGSVALTGRQTGIYTQVRPGGWNIVGQAPWQLVDVADGYFPLRTGDQVQFYPIGREEYIRQKGHRGLD